MQLIVGDPMKYRVTYFYLATGMNGLADTKDYGIVNAQSEEEAKDIVTTRMYPKGPPSVASFFRGCLKVEQVDEAQKFPAE